MAQAMTVGRAAQAAGLTRKAVRLYEERGLLPPAQRTAAGYRLYNQDDVDTLTFIRRAGPTPCGAVRDLLDARIAEIDNTITELLALRASLTASRDTAVAADTESEPNRSICPIIER